MRASRLRHLKLYMGESVDRQFAGVRLEIANSLAQNGPGDNRKDCIALEGRNSLWENVVSWSTVHFGHSKSMKEMDPCIQAGAFPVKLRRFITPAMLSKSQDSIADENLGLSHLRDPTLMNKMHFMKNQLEIIDRQSEATQQSRLPTCQD
ncbi:hypothetical protein Tco_1532000 [Tanacetum coccineum]